ncbi:poly ADP-ribose polymerase, partial [Perkinsus olseni]
GLRIAPSEAPVTGYMFGKGVYFADMVTKSANYCFASLSGDTGLLMLCEVALGKSLELQEAIFVYSADQEKPPQGFQGKKLPKSYRSTKGIGGTCPDPAENYVTPDGCVIPRGKPVNNPAYKANGSLLYNEYVVYDVSQVFHDHPSDQSADHGVGSSFLKAHKLHHRKLRLKRWRRSKWHKHHGGWPYETGRDVFYTIPSGPGGGPGGTLLTDNFAYLSPSLMKHHHRKWPYTFDRPQVLCSAPSIFIIPSGGGCGCGGGGGGMGGYPFMGPIKLPNIAPQYHYHGRHYYGASEEALMFVFARECFTALPKIWRFARGSSVERREEAASGSYSL